jgi:hypothetical protein
MTNFSQLASELGRLTSQFEAANNFFNRQPINKYIRQQERFAAEFAKFMKLPVMKQGLDSIKKLGAAMKEMSVLQGKSLATEKNLISTISVDQIGASLSMGIALSDLTASVISLRELGVQKLDKSTLGLLARMKATGQSTESLIKFLGANTSVMMLNQKQSQELAGNLAYYARVYQARQDDILRLATSLSKNFQVQAQLGAGVGLQGGFATLGAALGGRGSELIAQASQFFSNASLSQLQLLGIAEGFQERLAMETDPGRQKQIVEQMVKTAAATITGLKGGLGTDATSTRILQQLLQAFGGTNALVFPQLAKALEDAKDPIFDLSNSITGFTAIANAFAMPMQYLGAALNAILNAPVIGSLVKGLAVFYGTISVWFTLTKIQQALAYVQQNAARLNFLAAARMDIAAKQNLAASKLSLIGGGIFGVLGVIAGLAMTMFSMSEDMEEINKKTPDPVQRTATNAGLTGQIFSQLVNIVTSQSTNVVQQEMLATQKELVRLAQQQNAWSAPNSGLPTPKTRQGSQP